MNQQFKQFRYKRGSLYSVDILVNSEEMFVYYNFVYPGETPDDILIKFLEEAEHAALKKLDEEPPPEGSSPLVVDVESNMVA